MQGGGSKIFREIKILGCDQKVTVGALGEVSDTYALLFAKLKCLRPLNQSGMLIGSKKRGWCGRIIMLGYSFDTPQKADLLIIS
jgi:hypothetical protein